MMKYALFILLLFMFIFSGCDITPKSNAFKCIDTYPDNYTSEIICFDAICNSLNLSFAGSSSWKDAEVNCRNEIGAELKVEFWNSKIKECRDIVKARLERYTCYNAWVRT